MTNSPNMTYFDVANLLNGVQYREEDQQFGDLFKVAKDNRLVVIFGASDDLVELRGAIDEEYGAWEGVTLWINHKGDISTEKRDLQGLLARIEAVWCDFEDYSWSFKTDIPHACFDVMEDDEHYCRGIVFSLDHLTSDISII